MGSNQSREPWNKHELVSQKPQLKPKDVWAIRIHLHQDPFAVPGNRRSTAFHRERQQSGVL